jgi:hypothetical protein
MLIALPKRQSFEAPAGRHKANLYEVKDHFDVKTYQAGQDQGRLVFRLNGLDTDPVEYLAGKNYNLSLAEGTELRYHLDSWLKGDYSPCLGENGMVDLKKLIGLPAELVLSHHRNSKYAKPFVRIDRICPPGTLGLD